MASESGWITLHRKILDHWIYQNPTYFHAWITILMHVNHAPAKVLIGSTLFNVNRGESLKSLETWATTFGQGWTKQKVRTFLILLKQDGMVNTQNERHTTRLTVCNYDTYQSKQHATHTHGNTQITSEQHDHNTIVTPNNNVNNVNNELNKGESAQEQEPSFDSSDDIISDVFESMKPPAEPPAPDYGRFAAIFRHVHQTVYRSDCLHVKNHVTELKAKSIAPDDAIRGVCAWYYRKSIQSPNTQELNVTNPAWFVERLEKFISQDQMFVDLGKTALAKQGVKV